MTVRTAITITGLNDVLRMLRDIRLDALRPAVEDLLEQMGRDAADYPPPRNYPRSGRLGRGWTDAAPMIDISGDTLVGSLVNDTPYGAVVMGPGEQAKIHVDYWRTTDDIVDVWEDRAAQAVEDALDRLVS